MNILERYLTELLPEYPHKKCDTLAQVIPGTSQQRLHNLLTGIAFDHEDLNDQRVPTLKQLPSAGDTVLVFDDTGFAKQSQGSVGVQRQYSGTLGKTGNGQVTVKGALRGRGALRLHRGPWTVHRRAAGRRPERCPGPAAVALGPLARRQQGVAAGSRGGPPRLARERGRHAVRRGWLMGEEQSDGTRRSSWSNLGLQMPLVRMVE